jgi:hypothetical protein
MPTLGTLSYDGVEFGNGTQTTDPTIVTRIRQAATANTPATRSDAGVARMKLSGLVLGLLAT